MKNLVYYLDKPNGTFTAVEEEIGNPGPGEIRVRTLRTSVCQSDVVIYRQGLSRILEWPAVILHEASCVIDAVGEGVTKFKEGDLVALGCDIPCGDAECIYCGDEGTGDWTSCPNTQATGHEFAGFARKYAILPDWFVRLGPIVKFDDNVTADEACHLEPLACGLEGMTRVNNCIENRIVVLVGAACTSDPTPRTVTTSVPLTTSTEAPEAATTTDPGASGSGTANCTRSASAGAARASPSGTPQRMRIPGSTERPISAARATTRRSAAASLPSRRSTAAR